MFWAVLEFGVPLIFFAILIYGGLSYLGFSPTSNSVFFGGGIVIVILAVMASRQISKFFDKVSNYLNGR